ncbi:MAG: DEAD/DEAH box helicase family protein [Clostridia bacterium]|nr:DEAD/DEAH box helicase family protein [Clostridia bacterium]
MSKSYYFIFNDDCFDRDNQRSTIARTKKVYSKAIHEMNESVEELDRYDDFDSLKIDTNRYARTESSGEYGIPYDYTKHIDRSVILKHQNAAAIAFLKDLRGFGLLADIVGSGKTFEASLILSELAVRGKIKSMLLVVPGQVYDSWIDVLERQFGLGKNVLFEAGSQITRQMDLVASGIEVDAQNRPNRPIIVKTEDFVNWDASLANYLYDVIVVDEAHHLCKEDGEYAKAMKLLSMMMELKKKANVTYCLLLSATPHSGNLDHMFRLWYFIRCKGGHPADFDEKEDVNRSKEYNREKAYYRERVCRGATTVMEFIKRVKKSEILLNYDSEFKSYLASASVSLSAFENMTEGEQQVLIDEFLSKDQYENINRKVMRNVANAYHNGVLRSIMIRQPSTTLIAKEKKLVNYLYYPAKVSGVVSVKDWYGRSLLVDSDHLHDKSPAVSDMNRGERVSLDEYVKEHHRDLPENRFYADILCNIFAQTVDESKFIKKDFVLYYRDQMTLCPDNKLRCELRPMRDNKDVFEHKLEETKRLLRKHSQERILIFFDYELKKTELVYDRFFDAVAKDLEFKDRLIEGTASNKEKILEAFDKNENAVLIVKDPSFTEGVNLQAGSVIINFQVTPDPLAMDQRIGRIFRLGQKNNVIIYSLASMDKLEGFALMYFARIGLMSSNSGDATIIAGSNNDRMVAVQCERCGQVKLYSQEDYEIHKKNNTLYYIATAECMNSERPKGTVMKEISVYDFKCDKCSTVFARSVSDDSGYLCIANTNSGRSVMCNQGDKGDRRLYCRKICAMAHCSRFSKGECPAIEAYNKNKNIGDQDLYILCSRCKNQDRCPEKCRPYIGSDGISACATCDFAICRPKPHVIEFNDRWEAECPVCKTSFADKRGKLKPIVARTFAAYLRASWDFNHDDGRSFCSNLLREANKVTDIKLVLDSDQKE